jgi:ABC-type uncharacterized transport system ATPase subunit
VLKLTIEDARALFRNVPIVAHKLDTLMAVGLGFIELGQNATTLSGGEAQRVKLAKELSKRATGSTLYVLDEPTTGLHFHDIAQLLEVLYKLRDQGNTIVIIEHNLDVIKTADWIIDLGSRHVVERVKREIGSTRRYRTRPTADDKENLVVGRCDDLSVRADECRHGGGCGTRDRDPIAFMDTPDTMGHPRARVLAVGRGHIDLRARRKDLADA